MNSEVEITVRVTTQTDKRSPLFGTHEQPLHTAEKMVVSGDLSDKRFERDTMSTAHDLLSRAKNAIYGINPIPS